MEKGLLLGPIIGGLNHQGANIWGRASHEIGSWASQRFYAWLGRRPDLRDAELAGVSLPLSPDQGYAGIVPIQGLLQDTRYYFALRLINQPPLPGGGPLMGGSYPSFQTFPQPGLPEDFSFAFGSCFKPVGPDSGVIFQAIDDRRRTENLRFVLLIGDQIYADDYKTNGLGKVAEDLEEYRLVYERNWLYPSFRELLWNLPAFMTLDDHEVDDDWSWRDHTRQAAVIPWWDRAVRLFHGRPLSETRLPKSRVQAALQAYWEHQAMHGPPQLHSLALDAKDRYTLMPEDRGSLAYKFEFGAAAFFVMDTRSRRVRAPARSMLDEGQWQELENWLLDVKDRYPVKFLISSCALLFHMWTDIPRDRWSGFPTERDRLFSFLAANGIEGVYVLSGDLHSAHAVRADLYGPNQKALSIWEFCSSPFEQEPNKFSAWTRVDIRCGFLKHQECKFVRNEINFGVVRVAFDSTDKRGPRTKPDVQFRLYGEKGKLLETI